MTARSIISAAALALLLAPACSDDDNGVTPPPPDTTPPTVTTVTPVDQYHVDVNFSEQVSESSAEDPSNYLLTETGTPLVVLAAYAPGDTILLASAVLKTDKKSVALTTYESMAGLTCNLAVHGVADVHGNDITTPVEKLFAGSSEPDNTPPAIASRAPLANATGVATNAVITVQFSEPVATQSIELSRSGIPIPVVVEQLDVTTYRAMPEQLLEFNTLYTVDVEAADAFANPLSTEWSFTTLGNTDNTPPTIVSTSPANNAVNVNVNANLSVTFSEAIQQDNFDVSLIPDVGEGVATWSNGGKTVTFDPATPLLDDQQYVFTIAPGGVFDLAGNSIQGVRTVVFSTGSALETGRISGTISGDPGSEASDPTGATVLAVDNLVGAVNILASTTVAANDTYTLSHLAAGDYYILAELETGDIAGGNAAGAYGVNLDVLDITPDSVVVAAGAHVTGINFPLHDPSAIDGSITYSGTADGSYTVYIGLFHTAGFDPQNPGEPAASTQCTWPAFPDWNISTLVQPVPMGDYYVGAFMDVNANQSYDVGVEPAGLHGGLNTPTSIHLMGGNDIDGIVIPLQDPVPGASSGTAIWTVRTRSTLLERFYEIARRGQSMAK